MVTWQKVTQDEWEKMPKPEPKSKPSEYDEIISAVVDGEVVGIPIQGKKAEDVDKELRGKRIGMARRASAVYNVKLDFRYDPAKKLLAVRLSDKPVTRRDENEEPRKPGRPRKTV